MDYNAEYCLLIGNADVPFKDQGFDNDGRIGMGSALKTTQGSLKLNECGKFGYQAKILESRLQSLGVFVALNGAFVNYHVRNYRKFIKQ